jgi:hypothetical protein
MSFKAREIMIGVLPAARPFRPGAPGFGLCGDPTRTEEDDELECDDPTRPPGVVPPASHLEGELAVLRQQLRQVVFAR